MSESLDEIYEQLGSLDYDVYRVAIVAMLVLLCIHYDPKLPGGARPIMSRTLEQATILAEGTQSDQAGLTQLAKDWRRFFHSPESDTDDYGVVDLFTMLEMLAMEFAGVANKYFTKEYLHGVVRAFLPAEVIRAASEVGFVKVEHLNALPSGDPRTGIIRQMSDILDNAKALDYPAQPGYVSRVQETRAA
jgi:hypothetical protein